MKMDANPGRRQFLFIPAVAMSVGWGLRGYIGGGPLGAMIPGALVAMTLALLLRRRAADTAVAAGFGAIGVGFGGEMTYGETVGLISRPETFFWGLAGLSLKGAVWGLLGGGVLGAGFTSRRLRQSELWVAAGLLALGTAVGWRTVNVPRLISFSATRHEVWAGLLFGAVLWLFYISRSGRGPLALRFAVSGALGGGVGFGLGGAFLGWARISQIPGPLDSWKVMEFTFGFCFGLALGLAAWRSKTHPVLESQESRQRAAEDVGVPAEVAVTVITCLALMLAEAHLGLRFSYLVAGAVLLCLLPSRPWLAWQTAVSVTAAAFFFDFAEAVLHRAGVESDAVPWATAAAAAALAAWLVGDMRRRSDPPTVGLLNVLLWSAVGCSILKSLTGYPVAPAHVMVEIAFVLGAVVVTLSLRVHPRRQAAI